MTATSSTSASRREMTISFADLRDRPEFRGVVADRLWSAWWRDEGSTLADVEAMVGSSLTQDRASDPVPSCFVAH